VRSQEPKLTAYITANFERFLDIVVGILQCRLLACLWKLGFSHHEIAVLAEVKSNYLDA